MYIFVEVGGQLEEVRFLLHLRDLGSSSGLQAWQQMPYPVSHLTGSRILIVFYFQFYVIECFAFMYVCAQYVCLVPVDARGGCWTP